MHLYPTPHWTEPPSHQPLAVTSAESVTYLSSGAIHRLFYIDESREKDNCTHFFMPLILDKYMYHIDDIPGVGASNELPGLHLQLLHQII